MPASTHVKFFEYKPSGKDRKLQKTQTGCHSTFPIHLIRDVNQATTQNREQHRSSPLNTSHSSNSSNSTKSSSKTVNAPNNQFKPIPQSTQPTIVQQPIHQQSKQPFVPPLFHVTHPPKQLPPHPACISTTTPVQPTHYYAQALPSISHSYLKTIIHPVAVPPQSQHYLVHYHPHQSYHHAINNTIPTSYPVRISHGISKTHKMAHPVRQIRSSQPLSEKIYDLQLDKSRQPLLIGDSYASLSRPATSPLKTTQIPVVSKGTYRKDEQLVLSSSPPTVGVYSKLPSKISSSDLVYPCSTPTSHLNVGSQTLPSIADLFGSTQSKTFRSAISITDILN